MRLFYNKNISKTDLKVNLDKEETKHLTKVLRKKIGDVIYITNGQGVLFETKINFINKNSTELLITKNTVHSKSKVKINIAIAPTKMNDRTEWFIEKSTEIGIDTISPVLCEKSERKTIKKDRFEKIAISAMKQSLKYFKPNIDELVNLNTFINNCDSDEKFIAHCKDDNKQYLGNYKLKSKSVTVLIGPEGGFSDNEIENAKNKGFIAVTLGNSRLRTETAAVVATQVLSVFNTDI